MPDRGVAYLAFVLTLFTGTEFDLLRQEIAQYLAKRFQVSYDPEKEIMVTVGASEAIDLALRVCLRPGDEVILPSFRNR